MLTRPTSLAGLILLLLGLPLVFFGTGFFLYGFISLSCPPTAPVCRFGPPVVPVLIGGLAVAIGIVHGLVGVGILRNGRRAKLIGLLISILGATAAAFVGLTAFNPLAYIYDEAGNPIPLYSWQSIAFTACLIPYGLAVVILLLSLRQQRVSSPISP